MLDSNTLQAKKSLPAVAGQATSGAPVARLKQGRSRRALEELLVAEIFLVQATIESASALEQGFSQARRAEKPAEVLRNAGEQVFKSYRDRLDYYRSYRNGTSRES